MAAKPRPKSRISNKKWAVLPSLVLAAALCGGLPGPAEAQRELITDNVLVNISADTTNSTGYQIGGRESNHDPSHSLPGTSLTFDIAAGKTLTISGVTNTSTDYYLGTGGAINVNVPGAGATSPLKFTAGGHLVFEGNKTMGTDGGAVGAYFEGLDQASVFDFTGLESLTFSGNIAGNTDHGYGGGISSYSEAALSSVVLGDNVTFTGNIAGNGSSGNGGGISSYSSSSSSVVLGDNVTFTGNIAGNGSNGNGGGIYSSSFSSSVVLGDNVAFSGNISGNRDIGFGGGIYSYSSSSSFSSVELGTKVLFSNNRAGGNTRGGQGGAIWSSHSVSLVGHSLFEGNVTSAGGIDSDGAAIYLDGRGTSNTAALNTGGDPRAAIAFRGNYVSVDTSDINNMVHPVKAYL